MLLKLRSREIAYNYIRMFGKKNNKYNLLQKDESSRVDLDEMIELEDFRYASK